MPRDSTGFRRFLASLGGLLAVLVAFVAVLYFGGGSQRRPTPISPLPPVKVSVRESRAELRTAAAEASLTQEAPVSAPWQPPTESAVDEDPDIQRAINFVDNGNLSEATALLESVLRRDPKNETALIEMAMIHLLDLKQPGEATPYLQRAVEVNPRNGIILAELVSHYEAQDQVAAGLSFLQDAYAKSPDSAELAFSIGQLLRVSGQDAEAIPYLEKATSTPEQNVRALRDLGEAYARGGDSEKAIEAFTRAIASQEEEIQERRAGGQPVQFAEEGLAYTKMDKAKELVRRGETDQAQRLLDEVRRVMPPTDVAVSELQAAIDRRRSG